MTITKKWLYLPSLFFLVLALLSGVWLRLQWGWPEWMYFHTDYLIHGHSHVALLGWVFLGLAGLILDAGTEYEKIPRTGFKLWAGVTVLLTLLLFGIFVLEGYSPLSIILSTLHILLGYILAWFIFRYGRKNVNKVSIFFIEGAVFWMVMATAGPWLLAAGNRLPAFWMDAAVQYYLHLLFNGWFMFALAGLAYRYFISGNYKQMSRPFWLMMAGLPLSLIPQLNVIDPSPLLFIAGFAGTVLYAAGGLTVLFFTVRSLIRVREKSNAVLNKQSMHEAERNTSKYDNDILVEHRKNAPYSKYRLICPELLWAGLAGAVPVLVLPVAMAFPAIRDIWMRSDFLMIAFIHLHLLLVVTSLILFGIIQRIYRTPESTGKRVADLPAISGSKWILRTGSLLYLAGSITMVGILTLTGYFQITGTIPPFSVQKTLFFCGAITLTGAMLVAIRCLRKVFRSAGRRSPEKRPA